MSSIFNLVGMSRDPNSFALISNKSSGKGVSKKQEKQQRLISLLCKKLNVDEAELEEILKAEDEAKKPAKKNKKKSKE